MNKNGAILSRAKEWLQGKPGVTYKGKDYKFEFWRKENGQRIVTGTLSFGYLGTNDDAIKHQGTEYNFIGFDEACHISEKNFLYMRSRLRSSTEIKIPLKMRLTGNPPHNTEGMWVKRRYVDYETKLKDTYFLRSGLRDNPYLDHEEYEKTLDGLDPVTREQLLNGNWDIQREGSMFKDDYFIGIDRNQLPPYRRYVCAWDLAGTSEEECIEKGKEADYTAGCVMTQFRGDYFIEEVVKGRFSADEGIKKQIEIANKYGRKCRIFEEQEITNSLV